MGFGDAVAPSREGRTLLRACADRSHGIDFGTMSQDETPTVLAPLKFTVEKQVLALRELAATGRLTLAAKAAGVCVRTLHRYRAIDPEGFGKRFTEAREDATAVLEDVAWELATRGSLVEYFDRDGNPTHQVHKVDTKLLKLLLQANDPERYGNTLRVASTHTEVQEHRVRIDIGAMGPEERAAMRLLCKGAVEKARLEVAVEVHPPVDGGTQ